MDKQQIKFWEVWLLPPVIGFLLPNLKQFFSNTVDRWMGGEGVANWQLSQALATLVWAALFLTLFLFYLRHRIARAPESFPRDELTGTDRRYLGRLALLAITAVNLVNMVATVAYTHFTTGLDAAMETADAVADGGDAPIPFLLTLVTLVMLIPLVEELFFRGIVQTGFATRVAPRTAVLLASALFGLVHGHPVQMIYAFALGLFTGGAYRRYRNFKAPLAIHMAVNLAGALVIGLQNRDAAHPLAIFAIVFVPGLIGGLLWLLELARRD